MTRQDSGPLWFVVLMVTWMLLFSIAHIVGEVRDEVKRSNDIECIKLRESADSVSPVDISACGQVGG